MNLRFHTRNKIKYFEIKKGIKAMMEVSWCEKSAEVKGSVTRLQASWRRLDALSCSPIVADFCQNVPCSVYYVGVREAQELHPAHVAFCGRPLGQQKRESFRYEELIINRASERETRLHNLWKMDLLANDSPL